MIYNRILNKILSWIFPTHKDTKEDKMIETITEYFLIVNDVPYDYYRIEFCDENDVQIYLIYYTWEDAYNNIKKEHKLREDMSSMFPYTFRVNCSVSVGIRVDD